VSGICGIFRLDGDAVSERDLDRQMRALAHLGTDSARTLCDQHVGLGHLSRRITREDMFDVQPVHDPAGAVLLVADLRLDNREELAESLTIDTATLHDLPDSALLLAAYRRWGRDCARHLLGDFAFALWDGRAERLVLGRDHMGQRHLFFHQCPDFFAFATEIKGLWAVPDVPRILSEIEIGRMLLLDWVRPLGTTRFQGIEALPGGTILSIAPDGTRTSDRYWEPCAAAIHLDRDEAYYREAYRSILAEAVACRVRRATQPAGLHFSGGFDTTAIAVLAAPALHGRRLIAVTSVLPEVRGDSPRHARRWADLCARLMPHLDLHYVTGEGAGVLSGLERGFLQRDGPSSPNSPITDEMNRSLARAGARVVMDGYGGDYTLNPRAGAALARLLSTGQFRRFLSEFAAQRRFRREPLWRSVKRDILAILLPGRVMQAWGHHRLGLSPFGPTLPVARDFARRTIAAGIVPRGRRSSPSRIRMRAIMALVLRRVQDAEAMGGSIAAAAHGLEFTQPFHDKRVVELALAIPEDLYFRDGRPRYLARTALADLYPAEFQTRLPDNDDFIPDFMSMAKRTEPAILAEIDRLEKSEKLSGYFDFAKMRRMLAQKEPGRDGSRLETRTRQATLAFLFARYIEWFARDNA
jgi:asparagine synthase (glutamine-hydrolysing)